MTHSLKDTPFHLMRRLMQAHTAVWQQQVVDLTKPQYALLCAIAESPGVEQSMLMKPSVASKATLTDLLKRTEARGLVHRVRDTEDRRRIYVHLTNAGQQLLDTSRQQAEQVDASFMERLSKDEQGQLTDLIKRLL